MIKAAATGAAMGAAMLMGIADTAHAQRYSDVQWDYRPLLVFAPEGSGAIARQEASLAANRSLVADLKLAVYVVGLDRVTPRFGAPAVETGAEALRRRFSVAPDAVRVVLVGLDGGAKLIADEPISLSTLEETINAMPMRRRELREQS